MTLLRRFTRFASPVLISSGLILIISSCASPNRRAQTAAGSGFGSAGSAPESASRFASPAKPVQRGAHKPRSYPERRPEVGITTPMRGAPSSAAQLGEARLVASSCEKAKVDDADARVRAMRVEVNESLKDWIDAQPGCWEEMREEYRSRKEMEKEERESARHSSRVPRTAASADPLASALSASALSEASSGGGGYVAKPAKAEKKSGGGGAAGSTDSDTPAAARSASGTNNQVVGVDEADIVKTDGRYVYFAANGALRIAEALKPRIVSVTKIGGTSVRELFVEGNRAVVYTSNGNAIGSRCTYGYDCSFGGDGTATKVSVFDITNRAAPKLTREIDLSGSLIAARRIGNTVHTVVADNDTESPPFETWPEDMEMCGTPDAVAKAKFAKLKVDNERRIRAKSTSFPTMREKGKETILCGSLLRTAIRDGQAFTSVVSFDLADDKTPASSATLQSRPGAVFASGNALYLSVIHQKTNSNGNWYSYYSNVDEVSEIHKFRIGNNPKETRYVGSGTVPGHVLNQFAMDEWYGYLRVATTKGHVPDPKVESVVSVLAETTNGNLTRIGAIEKIAPGEDIRAVRFDDDRGYVVTFKKTDPLFVIDLFQPTKPTILGELKIPGFSTYIHRIDPEHLMSIGFDANDHGDFAYFDGVILQLFDVKKPTEPKLVHKEKIGTRGSSSQAATDHLAFNYFANQGLLAVPMTICEGGRDGMNGDQLAFSGLLVYDVDIERGFTRLGGVDHGSDARKHGVNCGTWWSNANSAVKRSVFLDDLVYSIATDRVKVQRMDHFGVDVADLSMMP